MNDKIKQALEYMKHSPLCAVTGGYEQPCNCGRDDAAEALATQPIIDSRKEIVAWPKPGPEDSTWTICPKFLQRIEDASGDEVEWMPSLEGIQAVLLALCRCDAPKEPQKMSDELRNVREVKVEGDFSVRLVFASCRSAEAFARAVRGEREEG